MEVDPMIKKPSVFRRIIMSLVNGYRRVMDVRYNPLKHIPDPSLQAYFMLVLFTVWSVFFGGGGVWGGGGGGGGEGGGGGGG